MMLVITVLATIAAMVIPLAAQGSTERLRAGASVLAADLEFARVRSVTRSSDPCRVVFDLDDNSYYLANASDVDTPIENPITKQPYVIPLGVDGAAPMAGVHLAEVTVGDDEILGFGPFGQLDQASNAAVRLQNGSQTITITLDATTGEITVGEIQ